MNLNNGEKKRKNSFHNSKKEVFQVCETACIAIVTRRNHEMVAHSQIYIYIYLPPFTCKEEAGDHDCVGGKG